MNYRFSGLLVASSLTVALAASAGTLPSLPSAFNASTGYVRLNKADDVTVGSSSFLYGGHWSDGAVPHSGTNYYAGTTIATVLTENDAEITPELEYLLTFQGDSLVVASQFWHLHGSRTFTIPTLHLIAGGYFHYSGGKTPLQGTAYIHTRASQPGYLRFGMSGTGAQPFGMKMVGDADSVLEFRYTSTQSGYFLISGDLSEYGGILRVTRHTNTVAAGPFYDGLKLSSSVVEGTVELERGTRLELQSASGTSLGGLVAAETSTVKLKSGADLTVGALSLADGVTIDCAYDTTAGTASKIVVTGSAALLGVTTLKISNLALTATEHEVELMRFPAGTAVSESSFALDVALTDNYATLMAELVLKDNGANGKSLCVTLPRKVTHYSEAPTSQDNSDFTNASRGGDPYWSDGLYPLHPDAAAATAVYYNDKANMQMPRIGDQILQFPGRALVLKNVAMNAFSQSGGLSIPLLILNDGDVLLDTGSWSNQPKMYDLDGNGFSTFRLTGGKIVLLGTATCIFRQYEEWGYSLVESELVGGAPISLTTYGTCGNIKASRGTHEFSALNTNFTGRITVSVDRGRNAKWAEGLYVPNMTQCVSLVVRNGLNLGGACASYTYNALQLEQYSRLIAVDRDITLSDGLNRGLSIGNIGRIVVTNGLALTVNWPVTLHGKLLKERDGTLVLGGSAMKFGGSEQSDTPTAGSNLVQVAAGWLKVTNAAAADGAAVSFDTGAGLAVDVGATAEQTLRLVKDGSSLSAAGAIPVRLDGEVPTEAKTTTVLCTTTSAGLTFNVANASALKGVAVSTVRAETVAGVTTYSVDLERRGFSIFFR